MSNEYFSGNGSTTALDITGHMLLESYSTISYLRALDFLAIST